MKKAVLIFVVTAIVLTTCAFWLFSGEAKLILSDLLPYLIIVLVIGFALFVGFKRLKGAKRGEPAEDEMSKKILRKTAAWSYYISLYLWLVMIYISDKTKMESDELIGAGILGMALTFSICWAIINFTGIKNE